MSLVRAKNTKPEMIVRRLVHSLGYRYALHKREMRGAPDLVFPSRRAVIFVHGCFWHRHANCGRVPKSRLDYWLPKLERNKERDQVNIKTLRREGWRVLVIWECQIRDKNLARRINAFLALQETNDPKASSRARKSRLS
jgi:DNA mismatch endonuclease (patch repair protein)